MTLLDAQQYDDSRDRRRTKIIIIAIVAGLLLAWMGYHLRNYSERHAADEFFAALQKQNLEAAFAAWNQDPNQNTMRLVSVEVKYFVQGKERAFTLSTLAENGDSGAAASQLK